MTSKRDLGPPLAIAGAVVVIGAIVAGFIAVGGPGDARDRRLDDQTLQQLMSIASLAQCAFNATGRTFATVEEMETTASRAAAAASPSERCYYPDALSSVRDRVGYDGNPDKPGDVTYAAIDEKHIRLCGNFRRPYDPETSRGRYPMITRDVAYPSFDEARPTAGPHCYEIELASPSAPAGPTPGK